MATMSLTVPRYLAESIESQTDVDTRPWLAALPATVAAWPSAGGVEPPRRVLLATDLHAMNVLAATRQPWLAIDPKPYVGDPHYDPVQHLLNCEQRPRLRPLVPRLAP
jgi:streptomycin 6-kinase